MLLSGGALGRDRCKRHGMVRAHDPIKVLFLVALGFPEPADVLVFFLDEGLAVLLQEVIDCLFVHRLVDLLIPVRGDPTRIDSWYLELGQRVQRLRIVVLVLLFDHYSCLRQDGRILLLRGCRAGVFCFVRVVYRADLILPILRILRIAIRSHTLVD